MTGHSTLVFVPCSCFGFRPFPIPQKMGHSCSLLFGRCLLWPNGRPSQLLLSTCYCLLFMSVVLCNACVCHAINKRHLTYLLAQTFFPSTVRLWNTLPVEICQLCPDHFKSHLNSIHFSWSSDSFQFLSDRSALFLSEWQFLLFATRLPWHASAYLFVVRYCSSSCWHLHRKKKKKLQKFWFHDGHVQGQG